MAQWDREAPPTLATSMHRHLLEGMMEQQEVERCTEVKRRMTADHQRRPWCGTAVQGANELPRRQHRGREEDQASTDRDERRARAKQHDNANDD
jgi:hypothetical protein